MSVPVPGIVCLPQYECPMWQVDMSSDYMQISMGTCIHSYYLIFPFYDMLSFCMEILAKFVTVIHPTHSFHAPPQGNFNKIIAIMHLCFTATLLYMCVPLCAFFLKGNFSKSRCCTFAYYAIPLVAHVKLMFMALLYLYCCINIRTDTTKLETWVVL
jgi:hypothetical protein